jgi:hypothetical protein
MHGGLVPIGGSHGGGEQSSPVERDTSSASHEQRRASPLCLSVIVDDSS